MEDSDIIVIVCLFVCLFVCFLRWFFCIILAVLELVCLFFEMVFLYNPGCPGTSSVDQAGLELTEILQPLPPECWDSRHVPPICWPFN